MDGDGSWLGLIDEDKEARLQFQLQLQAFIHPGEVGYSNFGRGVMLQNLKADTHKCQFFMKK